MGRLIHVGANGFPWATFTVNLSGSLVLGIVAILVIEHLPPTQFLRPFVIVGFLGAYTTYSTYMVETDLLVKNGHVGVADHLRDGQCAARAGVRLGRDARRSAPAGVAVGADHGRRTEP